MNAVKNGDLLRIILISVPLTHTKINKFGPNISAVLKDLELKKSCFRYGFDDFVSSFINPALTEAIQYDRLAGYFTSGSFVVIAKGLAGLYKNGGKMRLVCSPKFNPADLQALESHSRNFDEIIQHSINEEIEQAKREDSYIFDHVKMFGLLLDNKLLEIKLSIPASFASTQVGQEASRDYSKFHPKVGIISDSGGDALSFSGSINETVLAWTSNDEEFKVFRSWMEGQREYFDSDRQNFNDHWSNAIPGYRTIDFPTASSEKLIETAPTDGPGIEKLLAIVRSSKRKPILRAYQAEAVHKWKANGHRGIFEMATGTGKTFCALECIEELGNSLKGEGLIAVIACPKNILVRQWAEKDLPKYGLAPIIASSESPIPWEAAIRKKMYYSKTNPCIIPIVTTYDTLSSDRFIALLNSSKLKKLLVCDEVHKSWTPEFKKGLNESYLFRLGLTATLERFMDEEGTSELTSYFDGVQYEFSMERALKEIDPGTGKTFLCPYQYSIVLVNLDDEELEEYAELSKKISRMAHHPGADKEIASLLMIQRRRIIKKAKGKFPALKHILLEIGKNISHCIIYSPDKDENVKKIQDCLNDLGIIQGKITNDESEERRSELIEGLKEGTYKVVIAKKILDEGVDVPGIDKAIFMASSTVPGEFIQRRGRILRRSEGKEMAFIYDMVVAPGLTDRNNPHYRQEINILKKELERVRKFSLLADNRLECINQINKIMDRFGVA